jgi:hypothetical protein
MKNPDNISRSTNMIDYTNATTARIGPWTVRLVFKGERYGRDGVMLNEQTMPMVEFYDTEQDKAKFGPLGQFVTRYYLDTLMESRKHPGMPLCLHGGYPNDWTVSGEHMALVERWLEMQSTYAAAKAD